MALVSINRLTILASNVSQLFLVLCLLLHSTESLINITLAYLIPMTGSFNTGVKNAAAVSLAVEQINQDIGLLPNHSLSFVWADSKCANDQALGAAVTLMSDQPGAFIGPACSKSCLSVGILAKYFNKPIISYSCSSSELSDNNEFPTFARTKPFIRSTAQYSSSVLISLLRYFKWSHITILVQAHEAWTGMGNTLRQEVTKTSDLHIKYFGMLDDDGNNNASYVNKVEEIKDKSRVICILAYQGTLKRFLRSANKSGMMNGKYAFIVTDLRLGDVDEEERSLLNGLISMQVEYPYGEEYLAFLRQVKKKMKEPPFGLAKSTNPSVTASYIYDAIYLYALAANITLRQGGNLSDGRAIFNNMKNASFQGKSGSVLIDQRGNRIPNFKILNFVNGTQVKFGKFNSRIAKLEHYKIDIVWPGGGTTIPTDFSECDLDESKCLNGNEDRDSSWIINFLVAFIVISLALMALTIYYFVRKRKQDRLKILQSWLIKYDDIVFDPCTKKAFISRALESTLSFRNSNTSIISERNREQVFTTIGVYKSNLVAVKKLRKSRVYLSREILTELKQVREIQHMNINQYVGVCVDWPDVCTISMYCNKGSLQDVLLNDTIQLDWSFKMSFCRDIVEGMIALHHSAIHCHGNLKSSNCLIDSRWVCKVADYGLEKLKSGQDEEEETSRDSKYQKRLWCAPEHLRDGLKSHLGDVYSYGIILSEILTRDFPYPEASISAEEIVNLVIKKTNPPFRPVIPDGLCDDGLIKLTQRCWSENPADRQDFCAVKSTLRKLNPGRKVNLVDNMISMMEKYTDNLEELVEERTKLLQVEKSKTDALLYEMMPKVVADQLKMGHTVSAETFEQVTVFFSDIVGFTSIAAQSTAIEVVNLLNDLYTVFDNVIHDFNVYKVETIGDAYLVVSGLPERNGIQHAGEIATMSLHLLSTIRDFKIPHMSEKQLQLRIGIHSGSCVAGIVGVKKPRYDIFGDTVNYASRMESSGLALRIHVSPATKSILDELSGYQLVERGKISLKGIGEVTSFFLIGKDGFEEILPDLTLAAPLDQHEFK